MFPVLNRRASGAQPAPQGHRSSVTALPSQNLDSDARTERVEEVQEKDLEIRYHGLTLLVSILTVTGLCHVL